MSLEFESKSFSVRATCWLPPLPTPPPEREGVLRLCLAQYGRVRALVHMMPPVFWA